MTSSDLLLSPEPPPNSLANSSSPLAEMAWGRPSGASRSLLADLQEISISCQREERDRLTSESSASWVQFEEEEEESESDKKSRFDR